MPNMTVSTNIDENGGVSSSINMGGQSVDVSAGAGGSGASSSIHMEGFPAAPQGSYNYSHSESWNVTQDDGIAHLSGEGIDFSASISGTVDAGQAAAIREGWNAHSSGQYNEHTEIHGSEHISGTAGTGSGSAHSSIDMGNGQHMSSDVKINPDGSVSSKIDMGNGETMEANANAHGGSTSISGGNNAWGQSGSSSSSSSWGNSGSSSSAWGNQGGFNLVQLPVEVAEVEVGLLAYLVTAFLVTSLFVGIYFAIIKAETTGKFRQSGRLEQKNAYKEKFNFLES